MERSFGRRDDMGAWIRQRVKLGGGAIDPAAVRQLLQLASDDTALMANEIDKLLAYCGDRPISASDVDELVTINSELSAFALLDALADGDRGAALSTIGSSYNRANGPRRSLPQIAAFVGGSAVIRAAVDENASLARRSRGRPDQSTHSRPSGAPGCSLYSRPAARRLRATARRRPADQNQWPRPVVSCGAGNRGVPDAREEGKSRKRSQIVPAGPGRGPSPRSR